MFVIPFAIRDVNHLHILLFLFRCIGYWHLQKKSIAYNHQLTDNFINLLQNLSTCVFKTTRGSTISINFISGAFLLQFHATLSNWIGFRLIEKDDSHQTLTITDHDDRARMAYNVQAPRPLDPGRKVF